MLAAVSTGISLDLVVSLSRDSLTEAIRFRNRLANDQNYTVSQFSALYVNSHKDGGDPVDHQDFLPYPSRKDLDVPRSVARALTETLLDYPDGIVWYTILNDTGEWAALEDSLS